MPRFTAHLPKQLELNETSFEHVRLIKDRFSLFATIFPPFWMLVHRMWLELLGFFGIAVILAFMTYLLGADATNWLSLLVAILIGIEAAELQRRSFARRKFKMIGTIYAANQHEAMSKLYTQFQSSPLNRASERLEDEANS